MPKHDININLKQTTDTVSNKKTPPSKISDTAGMRKLTAALEKSFQGISKSLGNEISKSLKKSLTEVLKGKDKQKIDIDVHKISKELASEFVRKMTKAIPTITAKGVGKDTDKAVGKLISNMDKQVQATIGKLSTQIKTKYGVQIDPSSTKKISDAITNSITKAIPKETGTAIKEISTAVASLKSIVKEIGTLTKTIGSLRKTGGGIDITEINKFLQSLKKLGIETSKLPTEFGRIRKSIKSVSEEQREIFKGFQEALKSVREATTRQVKGVKERAKEDPRTFAKIVAKEIASTVAKVPSLQGTVVGNALKSIDKKVESIDQLVDTFKKVEKELSRQVKGKELKIEGVKSLVDLIKKLNTNLGNLPKELSATGTIKENEKLLLALENFSKKTGKIIEKLEVAVDTKALKKKLEDLTKEKLDIDLKIDEKSIEAQIEKAGNKAISKIISGVTTSGGDIQKYATEIRKAFNSLIKTIPSEMTKITSPARKESAAKGLVGLKKAYKEATPSGLKKAIVQPALYQKEFTETIKTLRSMRESVSLLESSFKTTDIKELNKQFSDAIKEVERLASEVKDVRDSVSKVSDISKETDKVKNEFSGLTGDIKQVRKNISKKLPSKEDIELPAIKAKGAYKYKEELILPTKKGIEATTGAIQRIHGEKARKAVEENISNLSKSLDDLQNHIILTLEKELKASGKGWEIVREKGQTVLEKSAYFVKAGGPGTQFAKQWKLQIADVQKLQKELGPKAKGADVPELIGEYTKKLITQSVERNKQYLTKLIGDWIKITSESDIEAWEGLDKTVSSGFAGIKKIHTGLAVSKEMEEDITSLLENNKAVIENVFKKTFGKVEAERQLSEQRLIKTISLPAARVTPTGTAAFETARGSQRALSRFATFTTGFEKMYETLQTVSKPGIFKRGKYEERIREIGIKPDVTSLEVANKLAKEMLTDLASLGKEQKLFIREQYKQAATMRGVQLKKAGVVPTVSFFEEQVEKAVEDYVEAIKAGKVEKSIETFVDAMDEAGVSAYDVAKSLDEIKFENIYDVYKKIFSATKSPLEQLGKAPNLDSVIRDYEKALRQAEQLMPIVEPGKPRRGVHQESVVHMAALTSSLYAGAGRVTPTQSKALIKDINVRLHEMMSEAKALDALVEKSEVSAKRREALPRGVQAITSLGIPEAQAGRVVEYGRGAAVEEGLEEGTKYLKALGGIGLKMYTENLAELAPFGAQFQHLGRNIASVTNAMSSSSKELANLAKIADIDIKGVTTEFPTLRTERERELITGGRYGEKGYGFNVVAELRHTAGTFEDQIIISGKLAKALTTATKTLVTPGPRGRVGEKGLDIYGAGVEDVRKGVLVDLDKKIEQVSREYQKILGVPQTYKGRADIALIEQVEKAISVVRGEEVEVQAAKLAEVFLNYFGRKITTRYGSKGVGITPTGFAGGREAEESLSNILQAYTGAGISVIPAAERKEAGLGAAIMPKSMGQLAAEMLEKESTKLEKAGISQKEIKGLQTQLIKSGNKFILDIFKKPGVIAVEEIVPQKQIFTKLKNALENLDIKLASDIEGITQLKRKYVEVLGKEAKLYEEKPIDVRISAHGIAKRGLQTEVLESVMSNIVGAGRGGITTMKTTMEEDVYKQLLGRREEPGLLSQVSEALGYKAALPGKLKSPERAKASEALVKDLVKEYGEDKEDMARRAAELEAASNFYVDIIDELGQRRKSLVGKKFVQIVEEPHEDPGWTKREIEKGQKGLKLNLPAFAAYSTIFGENSEFMRELQKKSAINEKEYWEYLKALQISLSEDVDLANEVFKGNLEKVALTELPKFELHTGTFREGEDVERSFKDTILDLEKFPKEFQLDIPKTTGKGYEKFYVPGALARGIYPEPLIAGEYGPRPIARRLQQVVNTAKEAQEAVKKKIAVSVAGMAGEAYKIARKEPSIEGAKRQKEIYDQLLNILSPVTKPEEILATTELPERQYIETFLQKQLKRKPEKEAYAVSIAEAATLAVGPRPTGATPEQLKAKTVLDRAMKAGREFEFAGRLGIDVSKEKIVQDKLAKLERAKIDYYDELAKSVIGKGGAIETTFFSRKIPAAMGKAVAATVDKTTELDQFSRDLKEIYSKFDIDFIKEFKLEELLNISENIVAIREEHGKNVEKYKKLGLPVLKQQELGVPAEFAKKIPVEFTKKYRRREKVIEKISPEKIEGSLLDLLKYKEELTSLYIPHEEERKELMDYIENELVPYIESVRFPFTGISSVQPYKAKLMKQPRGGRALGKHALAVPGMPEMDIAKFSKQIEKLREVREVAFERREKAYGVTGAEVEIEKLTKLIKELDKAISNVLPKYIAHQQKLDFDGDAIEIHSATTAKARKDIKKHFDSFGKDIDTTASVWRDVFTYEARQVPTGKYPLAEMTKTFEKKFKFEKGFEFLRKPLLTEELEYLKPEKQLEILATRPKAPTIDVIAKRIVEAMIRGTEKTEALTAIEKAVEEGNSSASAILKAIESIGGSASALLKEGIKEKLFEEKYKDAIEAQLFKIHTGPETEALTRLHRMAERRVGFGGGMIAPEREYASAAEFKERWPDVKALGKRAEQEFHTMMNELLRFGIQKGMDVKHAGEEPVAGRMVGMLARGPEGVEQLWKEINVEEAYSDLKDFVAANEKAIKTRLGELTTPEVRIEAEELYKARGLDISKIPAGREKIVGEIVKLAGFKGFLDELQKQIQEEAIKGAMKEVQALSPKERAEQLKGMDIEQWAKKQVTRQMAGKGINIRRYITAQTSPLYMMRTAEATPEKQMQEYERRYGKGAMKVPEMQFAGMEKESRKYYEEKYKRAKATAENIKEAFKSAATGVGEDAYQKMVKSTIDNLYKEQERIRDILGSLGEFKLEAVDRSMENLISRVVTGKDVAGIQKEVIGSIGDVDEEIIKRMRDKLDEYSQLAGVAPLREEEKFKIEFETRAGFAKVAEEEVKEKLGIEGVEKGTEEFNAAVEKITDAYVKRAQALYQMDKIIDVMKSKGFEGKVLQMMLPRTKDIYAAIEKVSEVEKKPGIIPKVKLPRREEELEKPLAGVAGPGGLRPTGEVVPVYLVGVAKGVGLSLEKAKVAVAKEPVESATRTIDKDIKRMQELASKASGGINELIGGTFEEIYRASGLAGGGRYGFTAFGKEELRKKAQVKSIERTMTGTMGESPLLESSALLGTGIHGKIQKAMKAKLGKRVEIERFVEHFDEIAGMITGHIDAIIKSEEGIPEKIIDIKTVTAPFIEKLSKLGKRTAFEEIKEKIDPKIKQKLEDTASQINFYLKAIADMTEGLDPEDLVGEAHFYDKLKTGEWAAVTFKYDEKRFKRDMEAVAKARENVKKSGKEFARTASYKELVEQAKKEDIGLSEKEINELIGKATKYYQKVTGRYRTRKPDLPRKEEPEKEFFPKEKIEQEAKRQREAAVRGMDIYITPPKVAEGAGLEPIFENLKELHKQAKEYQRYSGVDLGPELEEMPKEIKSLIKAAAARGPKYQEFIDITNQLKEEEVITGAEVAKAWKMYKMAVGDFYIKEAERAKEVLKEAEAAKQFAEANEAYGVFRQSVRKMQEYIRRGLGKPSDIYTERKRYIQPELAREAGVFMTPQEIVRKAGGPIGESEKLRQVFKDIVEDLGEGREMTAPIEKAREAISKLGDVDKDLVGLLTDGERLKRLGPEIVEAWDFKAIVERVSRLRAALGLFLKYNVTEEYAVNQRKNLEEVIKYLKNIENLYSRLDVGKMQEKVTKGWGEMGTIPVPKWLSPKEQEAMHNRNIQKVKQYFSKIEEEGGPRKGERYTYLTRVVDEAGNVIKNVATDFSKYGEIVDRTGQKIGLFSAKQRDLIDIMQGSQRGFRGAVIRAAKWGAASTLVYGGFSKIKQSIGILADIEMGLAQLRMVMSPLETDFNTMGKAAIGFAKQYGVPMTEVLRAMKIFAQQGLKQTEVIDRARTSTLAANVTTLSASDATEALTAAMKVFRQEGESSMRFMDAWSEVEAKHAITAGDMANALKKAASAGKNAGFTFDELNGIVAAVGSVTRQTGKEVGTAMRFIFRRLASEKGPKELAKLGIPVLTEAGELRKGFDILGDLSLAWKDLTSAQKMNVAQSIGGTRQYNALLVLMDNWDEALRAVKNSVNSKGSAERRNLEVMKTYSKQLEQTKAAAVEVQMAFGKIVLPAFKVGLKSLRTMFEVFSAVPTPVKAAGAALSAFFVYAAKGADIIDSLRDTFRGGKSIFGDLVTSFKDQWSIAKYEITGRGEEGVVEGLKTMAKKAKGIKIADYIVDEKAAAKKFEKAIPAGNKLEDFHSALGKTVFLLKSAGLSYNEFLGTILEGSGDISKQAGGALKDFGQSISFLSAMLAGGGGLGVIFKRKGLIKSLREQAAERGLAGPSLISTLKTGGLKGALGIAGKAAGFAGAVGAEAVGLGTSLAGTVVDSFGDVLGGSGQKFLKSWASQNTGLVKAMAPLGLSIAALIPTMKAVFNYYSKITKSAQDYEKSVYGIRRANESELNTVRSMSNEYDTLSAKLEDIKKVSRPEVKERRQVLGTYESPLIGIVELQKRATTLTNQLAEANVGLLAGYDKLGNAILRTTGDLKNYLKTVEKMKIKEMAKVEIDVVAKFVVDLTEIEGAEKWKYELKSLLEEAPVFGELLAKGIKVSPAKAIDVVAKKLNQLIALKNKFPLSTAFDKDIKKYQDQLKIVRQGFNQTYADFRRVLSEIPTVGLKPKEIAELLGTEQLRKGYELMIDVEPRFNLKGIRGKVKWEDVLGAEVIKRAYPDVANIFDATAALTKARLETGGAKARIGKIRENDIVLFMDELSDQFNIAGNQAIASIKETTDGVFEWTATYFNTKTLQIEERPFTKEMQNFVESVFPQKIIEEEISERIESLNEFMAGASAGLRGISPKEFKREFSLGERFFAEIPTTTLLQTGKGYIPKTGAFGESPLKKEWRESIKEFYFKPMREYRLKTEQLQKLQLEGLEEGGKVTLATGLYEELVKLQNVLKNNQVVLQYRAVIVDLMKTMEQGNRVLKENLAIEKSRLELRRGISGYMKGISEGLDNLDTGVQRFIDLTVKQRALLERPRYERAAVGLRRTQIRREATSANVEAIDKALIAIESIREVAKGFGAALSPEDMKEYTETIVKTGDTSTAELTIKTGKVVDNTAQTVDRLDQILESMGDPDAIENILSDASGLVNAGLGKTDKMIDTMEKVARIRDKNIDKDNTEIVIAANKTLDVLSKELVEQVGLKKATGMVSDNLTLLSKKFKPEELVQRAFGGMDLKMFTEKMKEKLPKEERSIMALRFERGLPDFEEDIEDLLNLQKKDSKDQLISSKKLIQLGAVAAVHTGFNKRHSNKLINKLDNQAKSLDIQIDEAKKQGRGREEIEHLTKEREATKVAIEKEMGTKKFYGTVQAISALGAGTMELAKALGLTEGQIKAVGVATLSTYAAMKLVSSLMSTEMPEGADKFGKAIKETVKTLARGEKPGIGAVYELKTTGKEMMEAFKESKKQAGISGTEEANINKRMQENITDYTIKTAKKRASDEKEIREKGAAIGTKARAEEDISRVKQLVADYLVYALTGYATEKQSEKTRLSTLNKRAQKQAEIFNDIVQRYPDAAQGVIGDMRSDQKKFEKDRAAIATKEVSLVLDTEKERVKIEKELRTQREELIEQYKKEAEEASKLAEKMASIELAEKFKMELEEMNKAIANIGLSETINEELSKAILKEGILEEAIGAPKFPRIAGLLTGKYRPQPVEFERKRATELTPEEHLISRRAFAHYQPETFKEMFRPTRGKEVPTLREMIGAEGAQVTGRMGATTRVRYIESFFKDLEKMQKEYEIKRTKLEETTMRKREIESRKGFFGIGLSKIEKEELKKLEDVNKKLTDELKDLTESVALTKDRLKEPIERARIEQAELSRRGELKVKVDVEKTIRELKIGKGMFAGKRAIPEGRVEFGPKSIEDLTTYQISRAISGSKVKLFDEYSEQLAKQESLVAYIGQAQEKISQAELDDDAVAAEQWKESLNRANSELMNVTENVNELTKVLSKFDEEARDIQKNRAAAMAAMQRRVGFDIERFYGGPGVLTKELRGFPGEVELPRTTKELTTQQRIFSSADEDLKKSIATYAFGMKEIPNITGRIQELVLERNKAAIEGNKDRWNSLTDQIDKSKEALTKMTDALAKFGETYGHIVRFKEALDTLNRSLEDVAIQEAIERIPGMEEYREEMAKLYGGAHPEARIAVSPEEERRARKVGIELKHLEATRYDVEEARLRYRLQYERPAGRERMGIEQRLADLPEARRRDIAAREQERQNRRLRSQLAPLENYQAMLQKALTVEGLPEDTIKAVREQNVRVAEILNKAYTPTTRKEMLEELKTHKAKLSAEEYKIEEERIKKAGVLQYRGIPTWEKKVKIDQQMVDLQEELTKTLPKGILEIGDPIADPIVAKLDETNKILYTIAEKEFGLTKKEIDVKTDTRKWYEKGIPGLFLGKASGGTVFGPGGPKEDKVPALLSPGEYVIKQASAQKLGYGTLDHMNQKGMIPGFADGGQVGIFRNWSKGLGNFISIAEADRLMSAGKERTGLFDYLKGTGFQLGAASAELITRMTKIPIDTLGLIETASNYVAEHGLKKGMEEASKGVGSVKEFISNLSMEQVGSIANSIGDALKGDVEKGGLGITSGILETMAPSGLLKKGIKSLKVSKKISFAENVVDGVPIPEIDLPPIPKVTEDLGSILKTTQKTSGLEKDLNTYIKEVAKAKDMDFKDFPNFDISTIENSKQLEDVKKVVYAAGSFMEKYPYLAGKLNKVSFPKTLPKKTAGRFAWSDVDQAIKLSFQNIGMGEGLSKIAGPTVFHEFLGHFKMRELENIVKFVKSKRIGPKVDIENLTDTKIMDLQKDFGKYTNDISTYEQNLKYKIAMGDEFTLDTLKKHGIKYKIPSKGKQIDDLDAFVEKFDDFKAKVIYKRDEARKIWDALEGHPEEFRESAISHIVARKYGTTPGEAVPVAIEQLFFMKTKSEVTDLVEKFLKDEGQVVDKLTKISKLDEYKKVRQQMLNITSAAAKKDPLVKEQRIFNTGGTVFGPGGPKEDKVPALLSPGEYVVKQASAKKLGYGNLEYMNQKGILPGFAEGGIIQSIKDLFSAKTLEEKKKSIKEITQQGTGQFQQTSRAISKRRAEEERILKEIGYADGGEIEKYMFGLKPEQAIKKIKEYVEPYKRKEFDPLAVITAPTKEYIPIDTEIADLYAYGKTIERKAERERKAKFISEITKTMPDPDELRAAGIGTDVQKLTEVWNRTSRINKELPNIIKKRMEAAGLDPLGEDIDSYNAQVLRIQTKIIGPQLRRGRALFERIEKGEDYLGLTERYGKKKWIPGEKKKEVPIKPMASVFLAEDRVLGSHVLDPGVKDKKFNLMKYYESILDSGRLDTERISEAVLGFKEKGAGIVLPRKYTISSESAEIEKKATEAIEIFKDTSKEPKENVFSRLWDWIAHPKPGSWRDVRDMPKLHTGGMVTQSGPHNLDKGEMVLQPKRFKDGGLVELGDVTKETLNGTTLKLDASDLISKLEDIELKVEETKLEVEMPIEKVQVEIPTDKIQVEIPTDKIQVEMPTDKIQIDIDTTGARSVGSDALNEVAKAVSSVNDKLLNSVIRIEEKIKMIDDNVVQKDMIDKTIESQIATTVSLLTRDINEVNSRVAGVESSVTGNNQAIDSKIGNIEYLINQALNHSISRI